MKTNSKKTLVEELNDVIDLIGEGEVFKQLFELGLSVSVTEKLISKRYACEPRGTTRKLIMRFLKSYDRAS